MNVEISAIEEILQYLNLAKNIRNNESFKRVASTLVYSSLIKEDIDGYSYDEIFKTISDYREQKKDCTCVDCNRFDLLLKNPHVDKKIISEIALSAKEEALTLLPINYDYEDPLIALGLLFEKHQFGFSLDNLIILDYPSIIGKPLFLKKLLAHELHHHYANQIFMYDYLKIENSELSKLIMFFINMAIEGTANLISMPYFLSAKAEIDKYSLMIVDSYVQIEANDFWNIISGENEIQKLEKALLVYRKEFSKFHAVSYFIMKSILDNKGLEEVCTILKYPLLLLQSFLQLKTSKVILNSTNKNLLDFLSTQNEFLMRD